MTDDEQEEMYPDYVEGLKSWLMQAEHMSEDTAVVSIAGIMIGTALAERHPEYTKEMHSMMVENCKVRWGGSLTAFGLMAHAAGDDRTIPEEMADSIADSIIVEP